MNTNDHALRVLEFDSIREMLRRHASSALGREAIDVLRPLTYGDAIREAQAETTEYVRLLETQQAPSLNGIYDIRDPLGRSESDGAILDPAELLVVGETVSAARRIRDTMERCPQNAPRMKAYAARLVPHPEIEDALDRVFDEQKMVRDSASRELSRVRKSIRQLRAEITRKLERLIRGSFKEFLAEPYYTHRDERYVLPVDARYQSKINGIIHDRSASGLTVYIEPMHLVSEGNRLVELHREESIEIRRILRELTAMIGARRHELETNLEIFRQFDFVCARAKLSVDHAMNEPRILDEGVIQLVDARHPLLLAQMGRERVMPLSLKFPHDVRGIIITGPNTGGKTVVLKTVGLMALMAQCGLHVSAGAGTEFPVYQSVRADIGDEQSLQQSLSTFSSHMTNIRSILESANSQTLVLLDELGSGTDPDEGGALSCAIVEALYASGCAFLTTTHLQDLKLFAHETPGVENGAMEFDMQSLRPTYRFTLGLPGRSNAIAIAERLGLPEGVIASARAARRNREDSPDELLARLSDEVRRAEDLSRRAEDERRQAESIHAESERRVEAARREARHIIEKNERKAQNLLGELERRLKELEKEEKRFQAQWKKKLEDLLKQTSKPEPPESALKHLRAGLERVKDQAASEEPPAPQPRYKRKPWRWEQIKPGVRVRIAGLTELGLVVSASPEKKQIEVSVNSMNLRIKADQILAVMNTQTEPPPTYYSTVQIDRPGEVDHEIDIHGFTVDEMIPVIEKYLDRAFRSGRPSVSIVHGHGSGILRREVRRLLSGHPAVRNFQNGDPFMGGQGVTVVNLNSRS